MGMRATASCLFAGVAYTEPKRSVSTSPVAIALTLIPSASTSAASRAPRLSRVPARAPARPPHQSRNSRPRRAPPSREWPGPWLRLAQVLIRTVEPVPARRIEDIDVERVLQRLGGVRQVGGD